MAKSPAAAKAGQEVPAAPEKPAGMRRYKVLSMAFIDGHRFREGQIAILRDGLKMTALEPLELVDAPSSIPDRSPVQTYPGSTPFPAPLEPPATR